MAPDATEKACLQKLPPELMEIVAEKLPANDLNNFKNFRATCRAARDVVTKYFARNRFVSLKIRTETSRLQNTTGMFAGSHVALGKWVETLELDFPMSRYSETQQSIAQQERTLAKRSRKSPTERTGEEQADTVKLLCLFSNLKTLVLCDLTRFNLATKLPLSDLRPSLTTSGTTLTELELERCQLCSNDIHQMLLAFPDLKCIKIHKSGFADGWALALRQIVLHGNRIEYLYLYGIYGATRAAEAKFTEGEEDADRGREFRRKYKVREQFIVQSNTVTAVGRLAVQYVLNEKILKKHTFSGL